MEFPADARRGGDFAAATGLVEFPGTSDLQWVRGRKRQRFTGATSEDSVNAICMRFPLPSCGHLSKRSPAPHFRPIRPPHIGPLSKSPFGRLSAPRPA